MPLRSWVRRSACPGRQQRLRTVEGLHLAFLVDAQHQRSAGTGRPAPSRRTADPSTGSRCGEVQKAFQIRGRRPVAHRTWSAGWVVPGGVSRPPNPVGNVVVAPRRTRTRFVAKAVETALRKAAAALAHCRRGHLQFRLLVGQPFRRLERGAGRRRRLAAPPDALDPLTRISHQKGWGIGSICSQHITQSAKENPTDCAKLEFQAQGSRRGGRLRAARRCCAKPTGRWA